MIFEAYYFSPWALINVQSENNKIISISFIVASPIYSQWTIEISNCIHQLDEYFKGKRKDFNISFLLEGSSFSKKVFKVIQDIPYGSVRTYEEIANLINHPKAQRAVGTCLKKNPLVIIIPCHRVVNKDNKKISYNYGSDIKKNLLYNEQKFS